MLLMFCTVVLFFIAAYAIPPDNIDARMETGSNLVLTAVALKLLSADKLPNLPYMTFLDKYLLGCIYLLIFLVFECVMLNKYCPDDLRERFDWWIGAALPIAW